ncbi:MAG: AlpA family transcriptional regulator [Rhodocyclales bacterium]|nr:AlpA family transcriptional regulator [Rhodocyclales bacterium]
MKGLDRYLRTKQVAELTGLSRAMIYKLQAEGTFPKKVSLSIRAVGWLESEVVQWLESRKSVVKTGREAKPAQPSESSKLQKRSTKAAKGSKLVSNAQSDASTSNNESPEATPTVKNRLRLTGLGRKTAQPADPSRRRGPTFVVQASTVVKKKAGPSIDVVALAMRAKKPRNEP